MKIIETHKLTPEGLERMGQTETLWVYNGLDCMVTDEVLTTLLPQLDPVSLGTYNFSRELIGPILEMNMRGVLVDEERRREVVKTFSADALKLRGQFETIVRDGIGVPPINPTAPLQVANLLYDVMGIPEVKKRNSKGEYVRTTDEDALNKCSQYFVARPIISHILTIRMLEKRVSTLETAVDPDGRMRTSFNIGGTATGRLASSLADFETGGNMQNWEDMLRTIFIPDPGMKFGNVDLAQADARNVGALCWNLFHVDKYLKACEAGDLHTAVARMCWPDRGWNGNVAHDRALAEQKFYRHLSYRDMSKKLVHATNFEVTPRTAEKKTTVPASVVADFQSIYLPTFPEITQYQQWAHAQLIDPGYITTPFGRRRWFLGRRSDPSTQREATAFAPQSMTADQINTGLLKLWRMGICQILLQIHDAVLFQFPEDQEDKIMRAALEAVRVPIILRDNREFIVPPDGQTGYNWGKVKHDKVGNVVNANGLKDWR